MISYSKIGYEEEFAAYSPGHLLFERVLESIFAADEIEEINCLSNDPWISVWRMEKRAFYNLFLYPRRSGLSFFEFILRRLSVGLRGFRQA